MPDIDIDVHDPSKVAVPNLAGLREQQVAQAAGPEVTEETRQLPEAHHDLSVALDHTAAGIHEAAGLPRPDPVADQAAGGDAEAA